MTDQDMALVVIEHLARLRHVRRADEHRGPLDDDEYCSACWRDATRQFLDELSEIRDYGTLFEREAST